MGFLMLFLIVPAITARLFFDHISEPMLLSNTSGNMPITFRSDGYLLILKVADSFISQFDDTESHIVHNHINAFTSFSRSTSESLIASMELINQGDITQEVSLSCFVNFTLGDDNRPSVTHLPGARGFRLRSSNHLSLSFVRTNVSDVSPFFVSSPTNRSDLAFGSPPILLAPQERSTFTLVITLHRNSPEAILDLTDISPQSDFVTIRGVFTGASDRSKHLFVSFDHGRDLRAVGGPVDSAIPFVRRLPNDFKTRPGGEVFVWDGAAFFSVPKRARRGAAVMTNSGRRVDTPATYAGFVELFLEWSNWGSFQLSGIADAWEVIRTSWSSY
jgi:hypothetical protein